MINDDAREAPVNDSCAGERKAGAKPDIAAEIIFGATGNRSQAGSRPSTLLFDDAAGLTTTR